MSRQLRVGIFVLFGLVLAGIAVFVIGDTRKLWEAKVTFHAAFQDVAGLKPGAPVRMGGLDIGSVTAVGHGSDTNDARIFVTMSITKKEAGRIRTDSIARIANKGLLGDKMVEVSVGAGPEIEPTQLMQSEEPRDVLAAANRVAIAAEQAIERLEPLAKTLADPKLAEDIKGSAADLHALLGAVAHGDGEVHRLLFDRSQADRVDATLAHLAESTANLDAALADVRDAAAHVRQGPGLAHALVYDGEISASAAGALKEVHQDLRAIREGNGLAHAILYGDAESSQHTMANLSAMTDDLRAIVAGVRAGKGTIGGLLVDPSVYEDIKSAVGNVERNEVLRALVRYSIKADEERPAPSVKGR